MTQPLPILNHMPYHIKKDIINSLDTADKFSLRQCSKEYAKLIDESKFFYESLVMDWNCDDQFVKVVLTNDAGHEKKYLFHDSPQGVWRNGINSATFIEGRNFIEVAVEHFVNVFRVPKVHIKCVRIDFPLCYMEVERYQRHKQLLLETLTGHLSRLGRKVSVGELEMGTDKNADDILQVLSCFQPGELSTLSLYPRTSLFTFSVLCNIDLTAVAESEQWKRAKVLNLSGYVMKLAQDQIAHFRSMSYNVETFNVEQMENIINNFLRKDGWKYHRVFCKAYNFRPIIRYLSRFERLENDEQWKGLYATFLVRRDGFECQVVIYEYMNCITVFDPKLGIEKSWGF